MRKPRVLFEQALTEKMQRLRNKVAAKQKEKQKRKEDEKKKGFEKFYKMSYNEARIRNALHCKECWRPSPGRSGGTFPGERKFLVSAASGKKIRVLTLLQNKLSPGTETEVSWFEPGCTDEYQYSLSKSGGGQDLFQAAGADDIFEVFCF